MFCHTTFNCWVLTEHILHCHQNTANTLSNNNKNYKYIRIIAAHNPRAATNKQINTWTNEVIILEGPRSDLTELLNGARGSTETMKIILPSGLVIEWKWTIKKGTLSIMTAP